MGGYKRKARYTAERGVAIQSALSSDGEAQFVDVADRGEYNFTESFSVSCFVKIRGNGTAVGSGVDNIGIINKGRIQANETNLSRRGWRLGYNPSNASNRKKELRLFATDGEGEVKAFNFAKYVENIWYHIAFTWDETTTKVYLNGVKVLEDSSVTFWGDNDFPMRFGRTQEFFDGNIKDGFADCELAHLIIFNKALTQSEITAMQAFKGYVPKSARPNIVDHQPLQADSFIKGSVFNSNEAAATTAVNQASHGFAVGSIIYYDGADWQLADGETLGEESDPPTVVVAVAGTDDFTYAQVGLHTFASAHGLGNIGDKRYADGSSLGTLVVTGNVVYEIVSSTQIRIASAVGLYCKGARMQYNVDKSTPFEVESYGLLSGYDDDKVGIPDYSNAESLRDFYLGGEYNPLNESDLEVKSLYPPIAQAIRLQNINSGGVTDMWVDLNKSNLPNAGEDFTLHWSGTFYELVNDNTFTSNQAFSLRTSNQDISGQRILAQYQLAFTPPALNLFETSQSANNTGIGDESLNIPLSLTLVKCNNINKWYINGVKVIEEAAAPFDYRNYSFFSIGGVDLPLAGLNQLTQAFGYWKRSLSNLEVIHIHKNGKSNNPWINLPSDYHVAMKESMVMWHQFQEDSFYEESGVFKVKNLADGTGATDAILQSANGTPFTTLAEWLGQLRNL